MANFLGRVFAHDVEPGLGYLLPDQREDFPGEPEDAVGVGRPVQVANGDDVAGIRLATDRTDGVAIYADGNDSEPALTTSESLQGLPVLLRDRQDAVKLAARFSLVVPQLAPFETGQELCRSRPLQAVQPLGDGGDSILLIEDFGNVGNLQHVLRHIKLDDVQDIRLNLSSYSTHQSSHFRNSVADDQEGNIAQEAAHQSHAIAEPGTPQDNCFDPLTIGRQMGTQRLLSLRANEGDQGYPMGLGEVTDQIIGFDLAPAIGGIWKNLGEKQNSDFRHTPSVVGPLA